VGVGAVMARCDFILSRRELGEEEECMVGGEVRFKALSVKQCNCDLGHGVIY